ncbi:CBS domain-containing protein [Chloroflexota bacterium]
MLSKISNIKVHYTWILVITLITVIVTTQFSEDYPLLQRVILGGMVALLFLLATITREFIFSAVTFQRGTPTGVITVFPFGGVYQYEGVGIMPAHWPLFYLARFLSNFVITTVFYGLYATFISIDNLMLAGLAQWLVYIYFVVFLLHFVPAFPLDGGNILRMILWRSSGNYYRATHTASLIGLSGGFLLIFAGVLLFIITQQWTISLLLAAIGWFLWIAAMSIRRKIETLNTLQNTMAQDIITREYFSMPSQTNLGQLIREHILRKGWRYVIVLEGTKLAGILTVKQIKTVPVKRWNNVNISDIMTPFNQITTEHPRQTADVLLEEMDQRRIDCIPIVEDNNIMGVVTRNALMRLVELRGGFGV